MKVTTLLKHPPVKFQSGGIIPKKLKKIERERLIYMCFEKLRKCGIEIENIEVSQDPTLMKMELKLSCYPAFPHTLVYEQGFINKGGVVGDIDIDWDAVTKSLEKQIDEPVPTSIVVNIPD